MSERCKGFECEIPGTMRCSGCKKVWYCSECCQTNAWERLRLEEERIQKEAEAAKAVEEEKARKAREEREAERAAAAEKVRLQREREEEAERRAAERRKGANAAPSSRGGFGSSANGGGDVWRPTGTPQSSVPTTPIRASMQPPRAESPAPGKYRPGALGGGGGGGGGGWRDREKARAEGWGAAAPPPPRSQTPVQKKEEKPAEDDGFQTVQKPGVWRPRRGG